jgi:hypothetical protein
MIKKILKKFNIGVLKYQTLQTLEDSFINTQSISQDLEMLLTLPSKSAPKILEFIGRSKSQLRQDLFVLAQLNFKRDGFFVEFGATNGFNISNTFLMEKDFGWTGILAEPAKCWHSELVKNRNSKIETNCVWANSHSTLIFNESENAELSTIDEYKNSDAHREARKSGKK